MTAAIAGTTPEATKMIFADVGNNFREFRNDFRERRNDFRDML